MPGMEGSAAVVNFTRFRLETHVREALREAWALSGGKPVAAADLLRGALAVARTRPSEAFRKLAELVPLPPGRSPPAVRGAEVAAPEKVAPPDLAAMQLTRPAAEAFSVAEGFLGDGQSVWGRDYVTLALLARDPSLSDLASQVGHDLAEIRRRWLEFVSATDKRRSPEAWKQWWRGAGIPLPAEAEAQRTAAGAAYLLTWNPERFAFPDLEAHAKEVKAGRASAFRWSTGNRRALHRGERVFLVRQGPEPRGLVGVGEVAGEVEEVPHWDEKEASLGKKSSVVEVRWVALDREPFVELPLLVQETGDSSVWSSAAGGILLDEQMREHLEEVWPRAWARHVHGLPEDRVPELEPRQWIARFDADRGGKSDSLRIDRYVKAFARVIASQQLSPPMSVGLFGDWGSGKTFFMDRLHEEVRALRRQPDADPPLYWHHICQIRFNAWHYTETNLWASLVSTIFSKLRDFVDGREDDQESGPEDHSEQFEALLNQLELVQAVRKDAQKTLDEARQKLSLAGEKVAKEEARLVGLPAAPRLSEEEVRAVLRKSVLEVTERKPEDIAGDLEDAARWSGRKDLQDAAAQLREAARKGTDTVESARRLVEEAGTLSSSAGFWWRVLCGARLHRSAAFWGVIVAIVAIPVVVFALTRAFPGSVDRAWAHLWTLVGEALTVTGAAVAYGRSALGKASAVFDRLGSLRVRIEAGLEEARGKDRVVYEASRDAAVREEQRAREDLEKARREEERAAEEERRAREALRDSTSQARLGRFIRERTSSADYEKHLGLIAMAHRDFEKLSGLMKAARDGKADPSLPRIDRIVLYIDDLDRCHPPEKVVRVLEAVHLLLFFPLFVVVVGVDSRWVSRSLYRHYEGMLADEAIAPPQGDRELSRAPAESQDFLEKIFQVPFWLRRMEPAAVQRLIHDLITPGEIEAAPASPPAPPDEAQAAAETPAAGGGTRISGEAESRQRAAAKRTTAEAELEEALLDEPAAPGEALRVSDPELRFMDEVAPLMPRTPRSVKRFVNIYRLYKAALPPRALARFLGTPGRPGNFRAVQVLLALVTGTPRFAHRVFEQLRSAENGSATRLSSLVDGAGEVDEASRTTLEALREFARESNDLDLADLREVSTLVGRYSVHHMVSDAPGDAGLG